VQLTIRLEQSEYLIRCPDGAHFQVEEGKTYVVMPSPFEVDEPDEMLWLNEAFLLEKARAGAWGFFLVSETQTTRPAGMNRQPVILNAHKKIDQNIRKRAIAVAGTS
jgi:hypothetical protein